MGIKFWEILSFSLIGMLASIFILCALTVPKFTKAMHSVTWYESHESSMRAKTGLCADMSLLNEVSDLDCKNAYQAETETAWEQKVAPLSTGKQF